MPSLKCFFKRDKRNTLSIVFPRCVEYLLRNDADPGVRDKQGYSAVHYASAYGRTLCLELVCTAAALNGEKLAIKADKSVFWPYIKKSLCFF